MFGIFNLMSRKNLRKLDAELSKVKYDDLIAALNQLSHDIIDERPADKNIEELRVIYAIIQCCLELQKIYEEDK